jgi:peptidoglycan hydrolase-like protein with peptidoglycan-binding domain
MGILSRKAALTVTAVLIAATATTAITGSARASSATTMAPASRAASVTLAASAAPAGPSARVTPASTAAATWSREYWPVVQRGARSVKVVNIQCLLRQWLGVWLPCNTRFNWDTVKAVKRFQRRLGLYPSGQVGPQTWPRLIIKVRYGDRNMAVLAAQASLRMAYRYPITIDGIFGPRTLAAVKDFQRKYGLKPNGVVGLTTWNTMVHFEW